MIEEWTRWVPITGLAKLYFINDILKDENSLRVILTNDQKEDEKVHVLFFHSVYAYKDTNESFCQRTLVEIGEKYTTDFYGDWTFFKVAHSQYIQWLVQESCQILNSTQLIHFSLLADNVFVDIIADYEPIVKHVLS